MHDGTDREDEERHIRAPTDRARDPDDQVDPGPDPVSGDIRLFRVECGCAGGAG